MSDVSVAGLFAVWTQHRDVVLLSNLGNSSLPPTSIEKINKKSPFDCSQNPSLSNVH